MMATLSNWLAALSFRPGAAVRRLAASFHIWRQYRKLAGQRVDGDNWPMMFNRPCFADRGEEGGVASGHYFHQDLIVARWIHGSQPRRHVDVGSRIDGFVAHLAVFREVEYLDVRRVTARIKNIIFGRGDLLVPESLPLGRCESVSCLHVIEHIGLGRYGDPLRLDGWQVALRSLAEMVEANGVLYVSTPVGRRRIEFNAHRIFAPKDIPVFMAAFGLVLEKAVWIDDDGQLCNQPEDELIPPRDADRWNYGCGVYMFRRDVGRAGAALVK